LHAALRSLLVPKDSLEEMIRELHDMDLVGLKRQIEISPQEPKTKTMVEEIVLSFAAKHYVDREMVLDRLMAFMFNGQIE
jgi:hypothetical protein